MTDSKQHWEDLYRNKAIDEVSWHQDNPQISLELIRSVSPDLNTPIIDIGGGASMLVDRLQQLGYQSLGVLDISAIALQHAMSRLGANADKIQWYEADITRFKSPVTYDVWHDRAVFHFLTGQDQQKAYIQTLENTVRGGGHIIIATFAIGGPTRCSGLDIVQYDKDKLSTLLGEHFGFIEQQSELHITPAGKQQAFQYFHFRYMP